MSIVPKHKNSILALCLVTFDKLNLKMEEVFFRNVHCLSCILVTTEKILVNVGKSSPVTGLKWPREFQEVRVPRFHDSGTGWW